MFYLPRTALDAVADEAGAARVGDLRYQPAVGIDDHGLTPKGTRAKGAGRPAVRSKIHGTPEMAVPFVGSVRCAENRVRPLWRTI